MNIALIDNYDSFTYNLAHLVREMGATVQVFRNDRFRMEDIEPFDHILLSPGPGIPSEAGLLLPCIRHFAGRRPILGVCLGHQAIGEAFGARLTNLANVYLTSVIKDEVEFSTMNLRLIRDAANILLKEENF